TLFRSLPSAQWTSTRRRLSHKRPVEALLLKLNSEAPQQHVAVVTFGAICDRYLQEELPERHSTSRSYRSNIKNYLKPRWGDYLLDRIRPMAVEEWLKTLHGPEIEDSHSKRDARDVRVCNPLGAVHREEEPNCIGACEGRKQAPPAANDSDCGSV